MARLPLIIGVAVVCLGVAGIHAQTAKPAVAPGTRSKPARSGPPPTNTGTDGSQPVANPVVAPMVTFRDGLLTVQATNSSLNSVVTAIRNKTGIEFEGVEGGSDRVVLSLGPAPEGEVLSAIFSGSKYDFVAIDRPDAPGIVQRVIVSVKSKPGGSPDAQQQPRPAGQDADSDDDTPDEQVNQEPQDTPAQPPQQAPPQQVPQAQQQPKSPEQLLQELQEMQKQKTPDPNNTAPRKLPQ